MQQEWTWRTNLKVLSLFIDVNVISACMDFLFFLGLLNIIQSSWISLLNLMQGRSSILGETHWNYHAPYHLTIPSNGNSEILTLMKFIQESRLQDEQNRRREVCQREEMHMNKINNIEKRTTIDSWCWTRCPFSPTAWSLSLNKVHLSCPQLWLTYYWTTFHSH